MSLTQTPKNAPWESPPEITDPEQAIEHHLNRLSDPDTMEKALFLLESGRTSLVKLVEGLTRAATFQGIHSIDVGLIAAPVLHEFIKQTAETIGIDYEEGLEDKQGEEAMAKARTSILAKKQLKESGIEIPEITKEDVMDQEDEFEDEEMMEEDTPEDVMVEEEPQKPVVQEEPKRGLMSRGKA